MTEIQEKSKPIPIKVILVGDSGVGKTSIIGRFINQYKSNVESTITTSFYSKIETIKDHELNFQIWDTVGQEQFRSLNSIFFKDAHICLLVYDITREDTFSSIKDYWYSSAIENGGEGIIIGVAGNKNDLYINEKVDRQEVRDFCNEINALFRFTSAVQNESIEELFRELGERFVESPFMKQFEQDNLDKNSRNNSISLNEKTNNSEKRKKNCC